MKELVEASPSLGCVRRADRDHLHVEGAHLTRMPGLAEGISFQEPQETKAFEAAEVEAGHAGPPVSALGQKHMGSQGFVALLGPAARCPEGHAFLDPDEDRVVSLRRPVFSGFFFRLPQEAVRSFADAPRRRVPRTDARRSVAR